MALKIKSQTVYATYLALTDMNAGELEEKIFMESKTLYNEAGKLISSTKYLPSGKTESSSELTYDENNNIIGEIHFIAGNEAAERKTYGYKDGLRVEEHIHYIDGSSDRVVYAYDEQKKLKGKNAFDSDAQLEYQVTFRYENNLLAETTCIDSEGNIKEKEIYIRDAKGNVTEKTVMGEDETAETVRNRYDEKGNLIFSARENSFENSEVTYRYDMSGNLAEENLFSGGKLLRRSIYIYDENNLVKEINESVIVPGLSVEQQVKKKMEYEFY